MKSGKTLATLGSLAVLLLSQTQSIAHTELNDSVKFVQIKAANKFDRTAIVNSGVSIEFTRSDSVWGFADPASLIEVKKLGFEILGTYPKEFARGGHEGEDFPTKDEKYHNYAEAYAVFKDLEAKNADITKLQVIGKSMEGRDIFALHINTNADDLVAGKSAKPGIVFLGAHHAREHLSVEMPLMLAQHLLANRNDATVKNLLETRDIWIAPMVNPDGAEFDIATGSYKMWRKNRRDNGNGTFGVDLNRNYGFMWGTGGSSKTTSSDVYMGTEPFSEPETQTVKKFVESRENINVLLSFHTFSELILYPWGHKYDGIENAKDLAVYEKMAKTMAAWNGYTPQQASDLYIASGDTTDWAYGMHGIFAFTFELSPKQGFFGGGFYPGAAAIDKTFAANLKPCLYMIDLADNPYRAVENTPTGFLEHYVQPTIAYENFWKVHPY